MNNQEYWQKRFEIMHESKLQIGEDFYKHVEDLYKKAIDEIEKDLAKWYSRLKANNDVNLRTAKQLLKNNELEEFKWTLEQYIKAGKENKILADWSKQLENASAKFHITRLESLQLQIHQHLEYLYGNYLEGMYEAMQKTYQDSFYNTTYELQIGTKAGFAINQIDIKTLEKVLASPWANDEMTFSDRIWKDKTRLINNLQRELVQAIIRGISLDKVAKSFANRMNVSCHQAGRLIATESAYFATQGEKDSMTSLGVKQYEILAMIDNRTSNICRHMDRKVFDMKDFKVGVTAPPLHVWCRSCTIPHVGEKLSGSKRTARDSDDSKTYYVDGNMKYEDWKKVFVDKTKTYEQWKRESKDDTINVEHKIVHGKNISSLWKRRAKEFKYEIDDVVNYQGFDGLPRIVHNKKEFLKLVDDDHFIGKRVYTAKTQEELNKYANDLRYGKWYIDCHVGGAQFGQGMYCSSDYTKGSRIKEVDSIMDYYIKEYSRHGKKFYRVETLSLDKTAKILYVPRERVFSGMPLIKAIAKTYVENNPEEFGLSHLNLTNIDKLNKIEFKMYESAYIQKANEILSKKLNVAAIATQLGYDAIKVERRSDDLPHTIILNRTKIIIFDGDFYGY